MQQRCAPGANCEESPEEDDGVDALAILGGPVGVGIEVEPDGELVEGEGGANAVGDGEKPAEEEGAGRVAGAGLGERGKAAEEQ